MQFKELEKIVGQEVAIRSPGHRGKDPRNWIRATLLEVGTFDHETYANWGFRTIQKKGGKVRHTKRDHHGALIETEMWFPSADFMKAWDDAATIITKAEEERVKREEAFSKHQEEVRVAKEQLQEILGDLGLDPHTYVSKYESEKRVHVFDLLKLVLEVRGKR